MGSEFIVDENLVGVSNSNNNYKPQKYNDWISKTKLCESKESVEDIKFSPKWYLYFYKKNVLK